MTKKDFSFGRNDKNKKQTHHEKNNNHITNSN